MYWYSHVNIDICPNLLKGSVWVSWAGIPSNRPNATRIVYGLSMNRKAHISLYNQTYIYVVHICILQTCLRHSVYLLRSYIYILLYISCCNRSSLIASQLFRRLVLDRHTKSIRRYAALFVESTACFGRRLLRSWFHWCNSKTPHSPAGQPSRSQQSLFIFIANHIYILSSVSNLNTIYTFSKWFA